MTDDFISDFRDDMGDEAGPDWLGDLEGIEDEEEGPPPVMDEEGADEFDQLRQRSARASSAYEDVEIDEGGGSSGFSLSLLTPGQRLVLAVLLLLNVIVIIIGVLAVAGILQF
jgi:hypothetical protein